MEENNNPNYWGVLPANVRYDKNLVPNAKLLYVEITSLCNLRGYCWANNQYFADLYDVHKNTISKWISQLEKCGYIETEMIYKGETKQIDKRLIHTINKVPTTYKRKSLYP